MISLMDNVLASLRATTFDPPVAQANIHEEGTMRLAGFPTITVTEILNEDVSSIGDTEKLTLWGCQVDVYAKNIGTMSRKMIARTLAQQVDDVLKTDWLMRRVSINSMPYDDETARFVLRFDCQVTDAGYVHRTT